MVASIVTRPRGFCGCGARMADPPPQCPDSETAPMASTWLKKPFEAFCRVFRFLKFCLSPWDSRQEAQSAKRWFSNDTSGAMGPLVLMPLRETFSALSGWVTVSATAVGS